MSNLNISYPKTFHLFGSKGVEGGDQTKVEDLNCDRIIVEEKLDGAEMSISFTCKGEDLLRNRNNPLLGPQFNPFYVWFYEIREPLQECLGHGHRILFGEWIYAKHSVFYDELPSYFNVFDIFDVKKQKWLTTEARRSLLEGLKISHVPVLYEGPLERCPDFDGLLEGKTLYQSLKWQQNLKKQCAALNYDWKQCRKETDMSGRPEGLYIKTERDGETVGFYKYIREGFLDTILNSGSHWKSREIIPNQLK